MNIERRIYRFDSLPETKHICLDKDVLCCAVSEYEGKYYMYIETASKESEILKEFNTDCRLYEIFHFYGARPEKEWTEGREKPVSVMSFIKLRPEKIAGYIYYHHRLELVKKGMRNKYYSIFIVGDLLISYNEIPEIKVFDNPQIESDERLEIGWQDLMKKHFVEGGEWTPGKLLINHFKK